MLNNILEDHSINGNIAICILPYNSIFINQSALFCKNYETQSFESDFLYEKGKTIYLTNCSMMTNNKTEKYILNKEELNLIIYNKLFCWSRFSVHYDTINRGSYYSINLNSQEFIINNIEKYISRIDLLYNYYHINTELVNILFNRKEVDKVKLYIELENRIQSNDVQKLLNVYYNDVLTIIFSKVDKESSVYKQLYKEILFLSINDDKVNIRKLFIKFKHEFDCSLPD